MRKTLKELLEGASITSKSLKPSDEIFIIDAMNLFHRNISANNSVDTNGNHIGGIVGTLNSLFGYIRKNRPSRIIMTFEGDSSTSWRKKLHPEYKGTRKNKGVSNKAVHVDVEEEQESFDNQLLDLITFLHYLPITLLSIEGYEGDDIIGWIAKSSSLKSKNLTIVSNDGDYLQLVSDNVKVLNPNDKIIYGIDEVFNKYGLYPSNFLLYKVFNGDTSDNIDGVKGIGLKTLLKSFPFISDEHKWTIHDLIKFSEEKLLEKKPLKIYENVTNSNELLELNDKLMNISDIKLPSMLVDEIEEALNDELTIDVLKLINKSSEIGKYLLKSPLEFFTEFTYLKQ